MYLTRHVTIFLAAMALVPLSIPIFYLILTSEIGDIPGMWAAYANSCILAAVSASLAALLAGHLLFVARSVVECAAYAAILFAFPSEFVAIGMMRFLRSVFGYPSDDIRAIALIFVETGYAFPFVAASMLGGYLIVGESRLNSVRELSESAFRALLVFFKSYWALASLSWLLGFNLILSESSRVTLLAVDAFGLGKNYFGTIVASAFAAQGVDVMLFVLSCSPLLVVLVIGIFTWRSQ